MKIELAFKVIWSKNILLPPMNNVTKERHFIGYTNRSKKFTYRLKPYIKIKK